MDILNHVEQHIVSNMIKDTLSHFKFLEDWDISFEEDMFFRLSFKTDDSVYIDMIPDTEEVTVKYESGVYLNIGDDCTQWKTLADLLVYWNIMFVEVALDEPC